jgi:serpin B
VDKATRLVLVNAIYFRGQWARQFNKSNTADASFSVTADRRVQGRLMNLTAGFKYAEVDGLQLLELPYVGDDLSLVVVLPRAIDGLAGMEGLLNEPTLDRWLAQARDRRVNVFLPKFKLTAQFRADHPFLFLIRDTHSGSVLFLGRVADPTRA